MKFKLPQTLTHNIFHLHKLLIQSKGRTFSQEEKEDS